MSTVVAPGCGHIFTEWSLDIPEPVMFFNMESATTQIFFFSSFFLFTWLCFLCSLLSCRSLLWLGLRSSFSNNCLLDFFWFFSLFLDTFSTYCDIMLFTYELFNFKSSAFWSRLLWIIFCLRFAFSLNEEFYFSRNSSLALSSSKVLLSLGQILMFSFNCLVEFFQHKWEILSWCVYFIHKKASKSTIFSLNLGSILIFSWNFLLS